MPGQSAGDSAQTRIIVEQVIDAALVRFKDREPTKSTMEITPGLKWLAGIMSVLIAAFGIWSVKTLNEVQMAVVEIRTQLSNSGVIEIRFQNLERRVGDIERQQLGEKGTR